MILEMGSSGTVVELPSLVDVPDDALPVDQNVTEVSPADGRGATSGRGPSIRSQGDRKIELEGPAARCILATL
jgi:hypothetical protein